MADTIAQRLEVVRSTVKVPPRTVDALGQLLRTAPDEQLFRMNPYLLAEKLGVPERAAVDLCLAATHAGLLEFTWGIVCPACGAFLNTPAALRALQDQTCAMCEVNAKVDDNSVEVAFTVSPSVRGIRYHNPNTLDLRAEWKKLYFSPSRILQLELAALLDGSFVSTGSIEPGANTLALELPVGRYALTSPSHHSWLHLEVEPGHPNEVSVDVVQGKFIPGRINVGPGQVSMRIHNRDANRFAYGMVRNLVPRVEDRCNLELPQVIMRRFLTGKELVTSQLFRELFRAESIPSDGGLEFKSLTLLFTDLKGSTELYEKIGDFRAYDLVREHFALLRDIVASRGGALVKTIGDAVMASFPDPVNALLAATEMNKQIKRVGEGALELKIGLHEGPCIAVESNERLDYFGRTVNIAARAQGAAEANQIVCTEPVFSAPGAQAVLARMELSAKKDRAVFKGVDGEVTVFRVA